MSAKSVLHLLTGEKCYREAAARHMAVLERFNGHAPDYRLYETAIRHWDDYWFGKERLFGDTFPHYWSILTAKCYMQYSKITGERVYEERACLCLFGVDGSASCAYVYPYRINEKKGGFYDPWANDQDFALYYMTELLS